MRGEQERAVDGETDADGGEVLDPEVLAGLHDLEDSAPGTLDGVVISFLRDSAERIATIRSAAESGDLGTVGAAAHSLKGSSANLAAARMAHLCADLEAVVATGDPTGIPDTIGRLGTEFARVRSALRSEFPGAAGGGGRG